MKSNSNIKQFKASGGCKKLRSTETCNYRASVEKFGLIRAYSGGIIFRWESNSNSLFEYLMEFETWCVNDIAVKLTKRNKYSSTIIPSYTWQRRYREPHKRHIYVNTWMRIFIKYNTKRKPRLDRTVPLHTM
jgi:hypothetical protein